MNAKDAGREALPSPPIPAVLVRFLEERGSVACAAMRDERLVPRVHLVVGWRLLPDGRTIACLVPDRFSKNLPADAAGQPFTLTVEQIGPHETYQFRGRFTGTGPLEAADLEAFESCRERFCRAVQLYHPADGYTDEQLCTFWMTPGLVARFEVDEIFLQTPGPGAGSRVSPPPETL